ncbi:hypothetical protein GCM10027612_87770 [Microbispora bryophytorum subsp. camponoti]
MSADDLLAEWLVNVVREQRRYRFWRFQEVPCSSQEAPGDETEQIPKREP